MMRHWRWTVAGWWALALVPSAEATNFNWTQSAGCGFFSCDFFNASYWSPSGGPPSSGDQATISMTGGVHLTRNTGQLTNLTLQTSTSLRTFGNILNVASAPGNLFLFGSGSLNSTRLTVDDSANLFDVSARTISLHQGSQLSMSGGAALVTFRTLVSRSSLISGHGSIALTGNNIGSALELSGTLRPQGGTLTITSTNSFLDLDGNVAGEEPGFIDVTSSGNLVLNGAQFDDFSSRFDLGNNRSVTFNSPWKLDGALNFVSGTNNRLIGTEFEFLAGAELALDGAIGQIEGDSRWRSGAMTQIALSGDILRIMGDCEIEAGASFAGRGSLANRAGSALTLQDGAALSVQLANAGLLQLADSEFGHATVQDYLQDSAGSLEIEFGDIASGEFDALQVLDDAQLAGQLQVEALGSMAILSGQRFKIIDIAGQRTGQFAGLAEGSLVDSFAGQDLYITYQGGDGNDVELYFSGLPGDFDLDGDVDGRDFLLWQRDPGIGNLSDWEANYGATSPLAAAHTVPEPQGLLLVVLVILIANCGVRSAESGKQCGRQ